MAGADVFVGVSGGTVPEAVVAVDGAERRSSSRWRTRTPRCTRTWRAGTRAVVATGRSDFPNQINNVLAFPGIFRGALDVRATRGHRGHEGGRGRARSPRSSTTPTAGEVVPSVFDERVVVAVAARGRRRRPGGRRRARLRLTERRATAG